MSVTFCVCVCLSVPVFFCTIKQKGLIYQLPVLRVSWTAKKQQGTVASGRRRGRPRTVWMDDIKMWTGLTIEESFRMAEDRDKWRKYVHGVTNPRIEEDEEQNGKKVGGDKSPWQVLDIE